MNISMRNLIKLIYKNIQFFIKKLVLQSSELSIFEINIIDV